MTPIDEDQRLKALALTLGGWSVREVATALDVDYRAVVKLSKQASASEREGTLPALFQLSADETTRILKEGAEADDPADVNTGFNLQMAVQGEFLPADDDTQPLRQALDIAAIKLAQRIHNNINASSPMDDCVMAAEVLSKLQNAFFKASDSNLTVGNTRFELTLKD